MMGLSLQSLLHQALIWARDTPTLCQCNITCEDRAGCPAIRFSWAALLSINLAEHDIQRADDCRNVREHVLAR
jgi:hypothetical protein